MGPAAGIAIASGGEALNSLLGMSAAAKNLNQRKYEFGKQYELAKMQQLAKLGTMLAGLPMADRAAYLIGARFSPGGMPSRFTPKDITNPGNGYTEAGGVGGSGASVDYLKQAAGAYTPGAGGFDRDLLDAILRKLGWSSDAGQPQTWGTTPSNADPTPGSGDTPAHPGRVPTQPGPVTMGAGAGGMLSGGMKEFQRLRKARAMMPVG